MTKLILASNNPNKLKEMSALLRDRFEVITLAQTGIECEPEETGTTFLENARIKAKTICDLTGFPAVADDSGLCVPALNGAPGIYSARYSPEHTDKANNALLLKNMEHIDQREAYYMCAIALVFPDGREFTAQGRCDGIILRTPRGKGGFGYDPLFYVPELSKTFAETTPEEKNTVSHRARALRELQTRNF